MARAEPNQLRIVAKFQEIQELALEVHALVFEDDLALQDEAAEIWDLASSIRKLAREIQELLTAADLEPAQERQWEDQRGRTCSHMFFFVEFFCSQTGCFLLRVPAPHLGLVGKTCGKEVS